MIVQDLESMNDELKNHVVTKHIREKHIDVEDDVLIKRFDDEENQTALYSKFKNEEIAAEVITAALLKSTKRIARWDEKGQRTFFKFFVTMNDVIGYGFTKDKSRLNLNTITIILCKNKNKGFRIKSAYPSL